MRINWRGFGSTRSWVQSEVWKREIDTPPNRVLDAIARDLAAVAHRHTPYEELSSDDQILYSVLAVAAIGSVHRYVA